MNKFKIFNYVNNIYNYKIIFYLNNNYITLYDGFSKNETRPSVTLMNYLHSSIHNNDNILLKRQFVFNNLMDLNKSNSIKIIKLKLTQNEDFAKLCESSQIKLNENKMYQLNSGVSLKLNNHFNNLVEFNLFCINLKLKFYSKINCIPNFNINFLNLYLLI
jgi:hypothetical protein